MGSIVELVKLAGKTYVKERGVVGTVEDAGKLIQGVGKLAKKGMDLFTSDDDNHENLIEKYEDEISREEEDHCEEEDSDDDAWHTFLEDVSDMTNDSDYAGALKALSGYYTRHHKEHDYNYHYLRATILTQMYQNIDDRPESEDFNLRKMIDEDILYCTLNGEDCDECKELTEELGRDFQNAKATVALIRDWDKTTDMIEERRDPDHIITTSKVNDALDAFRLLDEFIDEHDKGTDEDTAESLFHFWRAVIYNALFEALAKHKEELQALSDSQLEEFFDDAKRCAECAYKAAKDDEDKSHEEYLVKRIPEQIEMLRALRQGDSAPRHANGHRGE